MMKVEKSRHFTKNFSNGNLETENEWNETLATADDLSELEYEMNNIEHKECWHIHKKCDSAQELSDDSNLMMQVQLHSNPRFPKWPMSNWLNTVTVMIKVRPIGMWMVQAKRRLPNSV